MTTTTKASASLGRRTSVYFSSKAEQKRMQEHARKQKSSLSRFLLIAGLEKMQKEKQA